MKSLLFVWLLMLLVIPAQEATNGVSTVLEIPVKKKLTVEESISAALSDSLVSPRVQRMIIAQARHESGNFKNSLSRKHNNIFALWHSDYDSLSLGRSKAEGCECFARYASVDSATRSYIRLIRKMKVPTHSRVTLHEFVSALKRGGYFADEESRYRNSLSTMLKADSLYNQLKQ